MNYSDYHAQMSAIETAFNDVKQPKRNIVLESHTAGERIIEGIGKYLHNIYDSLGLISMSKDLTNSAFVPLNYLFKLMRDQESGPFSFGLVPVSDWEALVANDPDAEENWSNEMEVYNRMSPEVFFGACACRISIDTFDPADVADWCSQQAAHLAKYCITHNIDLIWVLKNI